MVLAPLTVPIPAACCHGWFFDHTPDCATPTGLRPCSDCGADPHPEAPSEDDHSYGCAWWFADTSTIDDVAHTRSR